MGKVTIKDVAKEAGVSISTVSNALNNSEIVNEDTRQKVLAAANRLNYVPNLSGKYLKSGKSYMLGFLTSSVSGEYFTALIEAVSKQCGDQGYTLNVLISRDKSVINDQIFGRGFDGVFIFEGERIGEEELALLEKKHIHTVLLDRAYQSSSIGSVVFDSHYAGYTATKHLINLGHREIAFIEGAADVYDSSERKRGFMDAMAEYGLPVREEYILRGYFEELLAYNTVNIFCRARTHKMPDAFICGNDQSAIGCINALKDAGYRVPEDVSVIGFDDIRVSQYFSPSLSTFKNPINLQGVTAARMLIDMIENNTQGHTEQLHGELTARQSTAVRLSPRP